MTDDVRPLEEFELVPTLAHLSSVVGHHLINSFSAVVSNAEILRVAEQTGRPLDRLHCADIILRSSVEAASVARKLIELVRPLTRADMQAVDLGALITRAVEEELAIRSDIMTIETQLRPMPTIIGRPCDLVGTFRSLLENAAESTLMRKVYVFVRAFTDERGWIVVEVHDDGDGMSKEVVDSAVSPFFSTKPGRLGIGLSIANSVWRRHRGSMQLLSTPGAGTFVRLTLNPEQSDPRTSSQV